MVDVPPDEYFGPGARSSTDEGSTCSHVRRRSACGGVLRDRCHCGHARRCHIVDWWKLKQQAEEVVAMQLDYTTRAAQRRR
jgi:hypothetical protein